MDVISMQSFFIKKEELIKRRKKHKRTIVIGSIESRGKKVIFQGHFFRPQYQPLLKTILFRVGEDCHY